MTNRTSSLLQSNVLLGADGHAVLSDLGLAREIPTQCSAIQDRRTGGGTPFFTYVLHHHLDRGAEGQHQHALICVACHMRSYLFVLDQGGSQPLLKA